MRNSICYKHAIILESVDKHCRQIMNQFQGNTTSENQMVMCTTVWAVGEGGLQETNKIDKQEFQAVVESKTGKENHKKVHRTQYLVAVI